MSEPRAVSKTRLIKWFRSCVDQAAKSGDWTGYDPDYEKAIRRLIKEQEKWKKRAMDTLPELLELRQKVRTFKKQAQKGGR
jgi:hypothetical protein